MVYRNARPGIKNRFGLVPSAATVSGVEHGASPASEQPRLSWWADNALIHWARTPRRRWAAAWFLALVTALVSLGVCVLWYVQSNTMPSDTSSTVMQFGLPFVLPLLFSLGPYLWFLIVVSELRDRATRLEDEVARRRLVETSLERMVSTDDLTGLVNRRGFFARAEATRGDGPGAVALMDLDFFKRLNDERGHAAGDEALRRVGSILLGCAGDPMAARLGGEEFGFVFPSCTAQQAAQHLHELRRAIQDADVHVTASVGVAPWAPGTVIDHALAEADAALYRAKAGGRNRVEMAAEAPAVAATGETDGGRRPGVRLV